jgi:hypothetical protein
VKKERKRRSEEAKKGRREEGEVGYGTGYVGCPEGSGFDIKNIHILLLSLMLSLSLSLSL